MVKIVRTLEKLFVKAGKILLVCPMISKIKVGATLAALFLLIACNRKLRPSETQEQPEVTSIVMTMEEKIDLLAQEEYGDGYKILPNKSKTVFLVSKSIRTRSNSPYATVHFFLYETKKETIIHRDVALRASVKWISDEAIKVTSVPGQLEDPDRKSANNGYIYDVAKRTKRNF